MSGSNSLMASHVGVDGCKAGWFAITRDHTALAWRVFPTINELVSGFPEATRIFIDIPIGLPSRDAPVRPCDRLARRVLGRQRQSSVFPVPCREALSASGVEAARKSNRSHLGRSVSAQTWAISPKIREVDGHLRSTGGQLHGIREIHPEVCFWALAGQKPMRHRKATEEGMQERLQILAKYEPTIRAFMDETLSRTLRKESSSGRRLGCRSSSCHGRGKLWRACFAGWRSIS